MLNEKATSGRAPVRRAPASQVSRLVAVGAGAAGDVVGGHDAHVLQLEGDEARVVEHLRLLLADAELEGPGGLRLRREHEDQRERERSAASLGNRAGERELR